MHALSNLCRRWHARTDELTHSPSDSMCRSSTLVFTVHMSSLFLNSVPNTTQIISTSRELHRVPEFVTFALPDIMAEIIGLILGKSYSGILLINKFSNDNNITVILMRQQYTR